MGMAHMLHPLRLGATLGLPRRLQWWQCGCWTARCCPYLAVMKPARNLQALQLGESLAYGTMHRPRSVKNSDRWYAHSFLPLLLLVQGYVFNLCGLPVP